MFNSLFVGKVLLDFEKLPSTNEYAIQLVSKSNPAEGTVISTYHQTEGRGQIGRKWESEPGRNISLSVILYPGFLKAREQSLLNQAMALAGRQFLADLLAPKVEVKWPNDVLVNGKKSMGILIQNTLKGDRLHSSVVGLGINVNQRQFNEAPNPTSLALLTGKFYELNALRIKLFSALEQQYLRLKAGKADEIRNEYLGHLYRFGENATFSKADGQLFQGTIVGISVAGKMQVRTNSGVEEFGIREIQFID